jgi:hypothetical protein
MPKEFHLALVQKNSKNMTQKLKKFIETHSLEIENNYVYVPTAALSKFLNCIENLDEVEIPCFVTRIGNQNVVKFNLNDLD